MAEEIVKFLLPRCFASMSYFFAKKIRQQRGTIQKCTSSFAVYCGTAIDYPAKPTDAFSYFLSVNAFNIKCATLSRGIEFEPFGTPSNASI